MANSSSSNNSNNQLMQQLYQLRLAISFLTLIPIAPQTEIKERDWARSIKFFSTVGIIFGLFNVLVLQALRYAVSYFGNSFLEDKVIFIALVVTLTGIFLSGGLHMDGLMDSFDGVGASKDNVDDTIKVMTDSRVGAFGAMAAVILIISKVVFLSTIYFEKLLAFVFLAPILSRFLVVLAILFQGSQGDKSRSSHSQLFKKHSKALKDTVLNFIPVVIGVLAVVKFGGVFVEGFEGVLTSDKASGVFEEVNTQIISNYIVEIMLVLGATIALGYTNYLWLAKKLYGHSGDSYGAGIEISEAITYFLAAVIT